MSTHISETARIGKNTALGKNVVILEGVTIGSDCLIGHNVVIHAGTRIGEGVRIDDNSVIGKEPLRSPRSIFADKKDYEPAIIGDGCLIGAHVTIYCGAKLGRNNLIADLATVREDVEVGEYNIIGRNVTIENFCKIGSRNKLETNSYITAYSELGDYCFVAPCVATSNDNYMGRDPERFKHFKGVTIKDGGRIGVNATILPGKVIGRNGSVAAGSVVSRDVEEETVVLGNPARVFKKIAEKQKYENNLDKKKG
ncbi:MAG: N-acetyltransferase [Candidatus Cloacimonetes bacterium]|nr:N-acetyltransferase [Candidatus Cloacimonadota bacterium]